MSAMNAYPAGTRVYFHEASGAITYGTIESTNHNEDGTQVANIKLDGGGNHVLPVAVLVKVR
ncbi:hypothetical protein SCHPADRAFT_903490 [Schizopora paradoxa]|uniref:Hypervirulence associated protein TUDOR domain-containing protein n=1 Tax=Schizopora paradoxa TaxID=27342 RepID=A0A0H2RQC7_9AGAM|nr:hypothetical protein SCHPADRAFT_903490 [Schizopora paradoxa]